MENYKNWTAHVGDRVVSTCDVGHKNKIGVYGTIRQIESDDCFLVEFDELIGGHDGGGVLQTNNGWWCSCYNTKLINSTIYPVITIQTDGKTTTATLREGHNILNIAKAVCCEEDEFDYLTGAKIALERVMEKKEEKRGEKRFEIGMQVQTSEYYGCKKGYVTHIDKDGDAYFTPLEKMKDVLRNGAHEHINCYHIGFHNATIIEDEEE